jgi:hypothetical protein
VGWIRVAQDKDQWRTLVNAVMNLLVLVLVAVQLVASRIVTYSLTRR